MNHLTTRYRQCTYQFEDGVQTTAWIPESYAREGARLEIGKKGKGEKVVVVKAGLHPVLGRDLDRNRDAVLGLGSIS